jgi:hypothetical protein
MHNPLSVSLLKNLGARGHRGQLQQNQASSRTISEIPGGQSGGISKIWGHLPPYVHRKRAYISSFRYAWRFFARSFCSPKASCAVAHNSIVDCAPGWAWIAPEPICGALAKMLGGVS